MCDSEALAGSRMVAVYLDVTIFIAIVSRVTFNAAAMVIGQLNGVHGKTQLMGKANYVDTVIFL
jgi:hypothetical protein